MWCKYTYNIMICWSKIKKMFNTRRFKWVDIIFCIVYIYYLYRLYLYNMSFIRTVIIMLFLSYVRFDIIYYDCHMRGLGVPKNSSVQRVSRPFYRLSCSLFVSHTTHKTSIQYVSD